MAFEAIAWRGLDNLFIPLFGFLLLKFYLDMTVEDLVSRLVVTGGLAIFVLLYRERTTLSGAGLLGVVIIGYLAWALGGWKWLAGPMILLLSYTLLSPRNAANSRRIHNIHAVLSVSSAGLLWLFLERAFDLPELYLPYMVSFAVHLAIAGIARLKFDYPAMPTAALLASCVSKGWVLLFVPYLVVEGVDQATVIRTFVALGVVAAAAITFYLIQPGMDDCPIDGPRWIRQACVGAAGSAITLFPLYLI